MTHKFLLTALLVLQTPALASCGSGNPIDSQAALLMGMGDPARFDSEIVKVKLSSNRYKVPANCFFAPIETREKEGDFFVKGGLLLRVSWPQMECRTRQNAKQFSGLNFHQRMQVYLMSYDLKRPEWAFRQRLFMATHPRNFYGAEPKIDNKFIMLNGETVYTVERDISLASQTSAVYTDNRTYFTYCHRVYENEVPSDLRDCTTIFFYGSNVVDITFDGKKNFNNRFEIMKRVKALLQSMSV